MAKKVLMISTYKTACGIAAYTEVIENLIGDDFEVDVFPLDQYVLRGETKRLKEAGDKLIKDLCKAIPNYDVVNLQFEPGLLAASYSLIVERLKKILNASTNIVVTMHTVLPLYETSFMATAKHLIRNDGRVRYIYSRLIGFEAKVYKVFRDAEKSKNITFIVHTKRESRFFKVALGHKNVKDHPISFIRKDWPERVKESGKKRREELEARFGKDKIFINFSGFLSQYKGIETAIEAMRYLPDNYVLLVYGGVHPASITKNQLINPYLEKVISGVEIKDDQLTNRKFLNYIGKQRPAENTANKELNKTANDMVLHEIYRRGKPLHDRVIFCGSPDDFEFATAIQAADVCIFPYIEVGQSASGPASHAVDLGKRTIVSRNKMFIELAKYFPNKLRFFDVGNHLELAQRIEESMQFEEPNMDDLAYTNETLRSFYVEALNSTANP